MSTCQNCAKLERQLAALQNRLDISTDQQAKMLKQQLTAERTRNENDRLLASGMGKQLAAEREKCKQDGWYEGRHHERKLISEEIQQLRDQLAGMKKPCR